MAASRAKWHPPPPPTPRIFHLARRSSTLRPAKLRAKVPVAKEQSLGMLMLQENRRFGGDERRKKVMVSSSTGEMAGDSPEERWRFQVDVLRAECNFLRVEREVALRKLERNRVEMESSFRSAVEIMSSGRKKLDGKGSAAMTLDAEIEEMKAMLEEIQCGFRGRRENSGSFGGNFDQRASVLRRRLQLMLGKTDLKEIREGGEITEPASPQDYKEELLASDQQCRFSDVEKLRKKMEGLSSGMRERMEEHGLLFRFSNNGPGPAGGDFSRRRRRRRLRQDDEFGLGKQTEMISSGCCCKSKELLEKIGDQVMAETEQWGEMQGLLDKVKADMEDLRSSREQWERRALSSELCLRSLQSQSREWKRRAIGSEKAAAELRNWMAQAAESPAEAESFVTPTLSDQLHSEICRLKQVKIRENQQKSLQAAKGKQVLDDGFHRRRSPLRETGNLPRKDSAARLFR